MPTACKEMVDSSNNLRGEMADDSRRGVKRGGDGCLATVTGARHGR
jgi:hypothetical protein